MGVDMNYEFQKALGWDRVNDNFQTTEAICFIHGWSGCP